MILDRLENAGRYEHTHNGFAAAFDFLRSPNLADLPTGRHEINGDRLFVIIARDPGRGRAGARLEAHRKYIDIQLALAGPEEIGWKPTAHCRAPQADFDPDKDIIFFNDSPDLWLPLPPGSFAVFFPHDAHAPLAGQGTLHKAVAKVPLDP